MNKNTIIKIINLSLMFFLIIGLYFNIIQIPVLVLILFFWFLYNHFIKKMMIENNDLKLKNKLKNESMEIFNELVIEISKLERIQKLKEEDFIVRVFRIFFKALNKADFGSVYLSNDG